MRQRRRRKENQRGRSQRRGRPTTPVDPVNLKMKQKTLKEKKKNKRLRWVRSYLQPNFIPIQAREKAMKVKNIKEDYLSVEWRKRTTT